MLPGEHPPIENVDLEIADAQPREQLSCRAVRAADHRVGARDKVIRHERDADVVIRSALEGVELPAEVTAARESDDAGRPVGACIIDELDRPTGLDIDINEKEMRLPLVDRGLALGDGGDDTAGVWPMLQREVDGVRNGLVANDQKHTKRVYRAVTLAAGARIAPRHHAMLGPALVDAHAEIAAERQRPSGGAAPELRLRATPEQDEETACVSTGAPTWERSVILGP